MSSKRRSGGAAAKPKKKPNHKSSGKATSSPANGALGGRPRKREPRPIAGSDIDGNLVEDLARLGTDRDTIVIALRIPRELLADGPFTQEFDNSIAFGKAWLEIDMLEERRGLVREGKVSATLAGLRQFKGWGRTDGKGDGGKADQQSAIANATAIIGQLGKKK